MFGRAAIALALGALVFGMDRSHAIYLAVAIILFGVEVMIALLVRDTFVRGYVGDMLAVVFVYAALRAATRLRVAMALMVTVGIALAIELAQAAGLLGMIGLAENTIARIVLGGVFDMLDIAAYLAGAATVVIAEMSVRQRI